MAMKKGGGAAVATPPKAKKLVAKKSAQRPPKPASFTWLTPCISVKDPAASIKFYTKAFGFTCREQIPGPDGKLMHVELTYKDQVIMLGPDSPECPQYVAGTRGLGVTLYLYHENVDALAKKAKAAGAQVKQEPTNQFWGDRTVWLTDPDGYNWMFGTNVGECDMNACECK